jgi:GTP-binding protein EngB required for normal cell division
MKKFLESQFEQDVKLIQKPKEVIFIGKANCGKSSLINKVLDFPSCRVSK